MIFFILRIRWNSLFFAYSNHWVCTLCKNCENGALHTLALCEKKNRFSDLLLAIPMRLTYIRIISIVIWFVLSNRGGESSEDSKMNEIKKKESGNNWGRKNIVRDRVTCFHWTEKKNCNNLNEVARMNVFYIDLGIEFNFYFNIILFE